jgi:hypothetical protein
MGASKAMAKLYPERDPQPSPNAASGPRGGAEQLELKVPDAPVKIAEHIKGVYGALQKSVDKFGGLVALAAALGKAHGEISLRVRREQDSKGDIQRAFLDYVAVIGTDAQAREVFLHSLCDLWGYKHPDFKNAPSEREQLRSLLAQLDGASGEAIKEAAARAAGFHPRSFDK